MKKIYFLLYSLFILILFNSCFIFPLSQDDNKSYKTYHVDLTSEKYKDKKILAVINPSLEIYTPEEGFSFENIVLKSNSNYGNSCIRKIDDENNLQNELIDNDDILNTNYKIDKINEEIRNSLFEINNSRASSNIVTKDPITEYVPKEIYYTNGNTNGKKETFTIDEDTKYTGNHCFVVADSTLKLPKDTLQMIGQKFDEIYEVETQIMGSNIYTTYNSFNYIQCHEKIYIVIYDINNDINIQKSSYCAGVFYQGDMLNKDYKDFYNKYYPKNTIETNERPIIYIDCEDIIKERYDNTYSTIIHEFNHLLNFVNKTIKNNINISTWYTEMLSLLSEDLFGTYLNMNINSSPQTRLYYISKHSNYGMLWDNNLNNSDFNILYTYANTYLFGAYLVRNFGGVELLNQIATNSFSDEESISKALLNYTENIFDFDKAYEYFHLVFFNFGSFDSKNEKTNWENYNFSMNIESKKYPYKEKQLYFLKINLLNYANSKNTDNNSVNFLTDLIDHKQRTIGPYGIDFYYINEYSSFDIKVLKNESNLQFYIY